MRQIRRKDTGPELAVRSELHRRGVRFRIHLPVPMAPRRSIDVALTRAKVAAFIDGCFWHGCAQHHHLPRNNREWWTWKLSTVIERDRDTDRLLTDGGWTVIRVWEHEDPRDAADQLLQLWLAKTGRRPPPGTGAATHT